MKKMLLSPVLILGLSAFFPAKHVAQQFLNYGDCIQDSIETINDTDIYKIHAKGGDRIVIRASCNPFEMQIDIELRTPDGVTKLGQGTFNEALIDVTVQNDGDYNIIVSDWQGNNVGKYHLSIQRGFNPPTAKPITCNTTVTDSITCESEMVAYVFSVTANSFVRITASADPFVMDIRIELRNTAGVKLKEATFNQAKIEMLLEAAGCYTILVNDWQAGDIGVFHLSLILINGACTSDNCTSNFIPEICNDNIDNDGDGFVDCEDLSCTPANLVVGSQNPGCLGSTTNGQITVSATGESLRFSIDGGQTWQSSSVFQNLPPGNYLVMAQNNITGCMTIFQGNPVKLVIKTDCVEICGNGVDDDGDGDADCNDQDCVAVPAFTVMVETKPESAFNNDGEIALCTVGGQAPYSLDWSPHRGKKDTGILQLCDANFRITDLRADYYEINITDASDCTITKVIKLDNSDKRRIGFPEKPLLTPNGDGFNDQLVFGGLLLFSEDNELAIYNRYGNIIYYRKPYLNNWNGTWNGEPVPADTYFYTLKIINAMGEKETFTGYITVVW